MHTLKVRAAESNARGGMDLLGCFHPVRLSNLPRKRSRASWDPSFFKLHPVSKKYDALYS